MRSEPESSQDANPLAAAPLGEPDAARLPFPVVGVGASAGGLEAITELLQHVPSNTGMAFIVVQHLDRGHPSELTSLLARSTSMPVAQIQDGATVQPNHVYVIPPDVNVVMAEGRLKHTPRPGSRIPNSVDHFFSSLAKEQQSYAIGIVLSGTGSDGAMGLREINGAGGITFAQDERSAKFAGMPLQAAANPVDFVLPPERIAFELARIGSNPYLAVPSPREMAQEAAQREYRRILTILHAHTGVDFSQYRESTIKRRIQRRMVVRTRETLRSYAEMLEGDKGEVTALYDDVLINVTSFFRDGEMFEALKTRVFPEILKNKPKVIRVWSVACSSGQEAYSLAISLVEFLEKTPDPPAIQIFATDISDSGAIDKGRKGIYTQAIEEEMSPERLARFFTKDDGHYRINKDIRDLCIFARQNIAADPPFAHIDIISCRNMLIYMVPTLQRQVVSTFHYALNPSGFLILGASETVGANSDLFQPADRKHKIFSRKNAAIRPFSHFAALDAKHQPSPSRQRPPPPSTPADFQREADRIVLSRYAPAGVLVNSTLDVLQFRGRTTRYLEPPTGEASFNLLKMARGNLAIELGRAVREAREKSAVVRRVARLHDHTTVRKVRVEVTPVVLPGSAESCFLILFEDVDKDPPEPGAAGGDAPTPMHPDEKDQELKHLKAELAGAREYLQTIMEQQEGANEELKCANEEILSSNEELQSTNEQLGTAKEELQSTNEELQTVNDELQARNIDLSRLNNDLTNVLASISIPVLILGMDLRVRRFNQAAVEILKIKPSVMGRLLYSLNSPLLAPSLERSLAEVASQGTPVEIEIPDADYHWYSVRLTPYRTLDNRIDGVVVALVDINELKRANERLLDYVTAIVDTVRAPLLVLRTDLRVATANDAFLQMFLVTKAESENRLVYELGGGQWNIESLRNKLSEILSVQPLMKDFEVVHTFPRIGLRTMRLNARRLDQKANAAPMILLSFEDITEWKQTREKNQWLAAIVESSDDAIIGQDLDGKIISCNQGAAQLYGYEVPELIGQSLQILAPSRLHHEQLEILERIRRGENINHYETCRIRKDGAQINVSLTISPVKDLDGKVIGASKIARDITERIRAAQKLQESYAREQAARAEAERASRAKDDFLAALSHELRTPLNPILLLASDAAEDKALPPSVRHRFETVRKNIELEARLIDDLLDLTRIAAGKLSLDLAVVDDVPRVFHDALANVQSEIHSKQIEVTSAILPDRQSVLADAVRLQQVFWNVLRNAVKFTPNGGKITVDSVVEAGRLRLRITDSGIGMTPEELARAFAAFSQGDHAGEQAHRFGGLGMGLAISKRLIELHGGTIRAESEGRNQGATITIDLPLAQPDTAPLPSSALADPRPPVSTALSSNTRAPSETTILLVEDHEPTRNALENLLKRRGYKMIAAGSLAEARTRAAQEKVDFVVSDIGLPDGNGNTLMKELAEQYGLKGIALTGYGMEEDVNRSLSSGFVAHLTKPVHVQALEKALTVLMTR